MTEFNNLTNNQKIGLNMLAVSGIAMVSILATQPFTWAILYSGIIAGVLTGLIQLRDATNNINNGILMVI